MNEPTKDVRHAVGYASEIGRTHRINQDAGGAWTWTRDDGTPVSLLIVADGVSAGKHSEDASRLALTQLYDRMGRELQLEHMTQDGAMRALVAATVETNHLIAQRPHISTSNADATTLVAAFCIGTQGGGVWVGDSRVYRVSPEGIEALTRDHSWAERAVRDGVMTAEQAADDPRAHMITRWLGPPDGDDPGVESFLFTLEPTDCILCCSDGLYGYYEPPHGSLAELPRLLQGSPGELQGACERAVDRAIERGGHDDITLAALQRTN